MADLAFSPDGTRLTFVVAEPPQGTRRERHIWMLDLPSRQVRQLTYSDKTERSPQWSPDGTSLAFISDRDGDPHLYVLPMAAGGEAQRIVPNEEAVTAFRWSPDGARLAFLMAEPKPDALKAREKDKDDGRRVDRDERRERVWILDVATRALRQVTSGDRRIDEIEWLDGGHLASIGTDQPASDRMTDRMDVIDVATGQFSPLAQTHGPIGNLRVAPGGTRTAWIGARVDGPEPHDIWVAERGSAPRNLTAASLDRPVRDLHWTDDGTLLAIVERGFTSAVVTVSVDGTARSIDAIAGNPSSVVRSRSGTLAYVGETATVAPEIWVKPSDGIAEPATTFNASWRDVALTAPSIIHYKSVDGIDIEAALLNPGGQPAKRPFVVLVHGGPTGRWSDAFEPWGQLLAARGYAVLYPNIRGSTGYGQRFVELNRGDWGGADFKDVMAGVDAMVAVGVADPARLAIGGWSYGGYMAAWAVTQTDRFKAAVSGAPMSDLASEFGTEAGPAYDEWFYGVPYEKPDGFIRSSPITYVTQAKTPTLILQGDADVTDPIGQSQQLYRALKRYAVETELVLYPREGHGLREEKHLLDRLTRILAWYDRFLKPPPSH